MWPCLLTDKGVDAPTTLQPEPTSRGREGIENNQHFRERHPGVAPGHVEIVPLTKEAAE